MIWGITGCVCCPIGERRRRVLLRSTASAQLFDAIEASQLTEEEKGNRAQLRVSGDFHGLKEAWFALSPTPSPGGGEGVISASTFG